LERDDKGSEGAWQTELFLPGSGMACWARDDIVHAFSLRFPVTFPAAVATSVWRVLYGRAAAALVHYL